MIRSLSRAGVNLHITTLMWFWGLEMEGTEPILLTCLDAARCRDHLGKGFTWGGKSAVSTRFHSRPGPYTDRASF